MLNRRGELTILLYEKEKCLYVNERIISVVFLDIAPLFFFFRHFHKEEESKYTFITGGITKDKLMKF